MKAFGLSLVLICTVALGQQPAEPAGLICNAQHPCDQQTPPTSSYFTCGEHNRNGVALSNAYGCHPAQKGKQVQPPMEEKWIMADLPSQTQHNYEFSGAGLTGYITIATPESTVVKLSDEEYSKLQALRQAVVDEEKRLAVKYGAKGWSVMQDPAHASDENFVAPDHYEFHQQFLLIDKAPSMKQNSGYSDWVKSVDWGPSFGLYTPTSEPWASDFCRQFPSASDQGMNHCDGPGCSPLILILNRFSDGSVLTTDPHK